MGKLTEEQQQQLDELTALASAPDDDFEIEIGSGENWARVPGSHAAKWLFDNFGIGDGPAAPPASADDGQGDEGDKPRPRPKPRAKPPAAPGGSEPLRKYFGVKK